MLVLLIGRNRIRTTLLTAILSPAAGGLAASVPALARALDRHGAAVSVVGIVDPAAPEAAQDWGPSVHAHRARSPRAFGYAPGLSATLAQLAPDVIDVQGLWTYPSLASLRHHHRTGAPYVVTPHGMLDPWARARSAWKKRIVRLWFEDEHLRHAACLRATAEMEAEHFRSFGLRNPIAVVPNGVDVPPLVHPARTNGAPRRLLFLSRIHPKKGLPLLLRAWARLASAHQDWELFIAGPDEVGHTAEMKRLASRIGLERLHWSGPVEGEAKTALYRSADLFVLPTHAENFGLVVAEALAHGVPVVTTRHAPWEGLQTHRCGWWIPLEEAVLTETLAQAMTCDIQELHEMGVRGHRWMEREFNWKSVAEKMATVYDWVIGKAARPDTVHL
jgi:glycosyltransferase involved in cell wall biosynthesis